MSGARDWLRTRTPPPPARLMRRMEQALAASPATDDLFVQLGDAALDCLRHALRATAREAAALDLLAADGLLTYAWEAAGRGGVDALDRFADAYDPARLAALLPETR